MARISISYFDLLLGMCFCCLFGTPQVSAERPDSATVANNQALNAILDETMAGQPVELLSQLESFVATHAGFVRGYQTLLDSYIFKNQAEMARSFFGKLAALPEHRRYCKWMLARLSKIQKRQKDAYRFFVEAIQASPTDSLPVELLWRFAGFATRRGKGVASRTLLANTVRDSSLAKLVTGFYLIENSQPDKFIDLLDPIAARFATHQIILRLLGYCYSVRGEHETAANYWEQAFDGARASQDTRASARFLSYLGYSKERQGDYEGAIAICERASTLAKSIGDKRQIAYIEGLLGYLHHEMGRYEEADHHFTLAISNVTQLNSNWEVVELYRGLAYSRYRQGKYQDALDFLRKCEGLLAGEKTGEPYCLVKYEKADILVSLEQLDLAEQSLRLAVAAARKSGFAYREKEAKAALGDIARKRGDFEQARRLYREFIAYLKSKNLTKKYYGWQAKIADCYLEERDFERARVETLKALALARRAKAEASEGHSLNGLARIELAKVQLNSALAHSQQALAIAKRIGNNELQVKSNVTTGDIYQSQGKLHEAITYYSSAGRIVEKTRAGLQAGRLRRGYFAQGFDAYNGLVDCYYQAYLEDGEPAYIDSLLFYYQRGRSRVLNEMRMSGTVKHNADYQQACQNLRVLQRRVRDRKQQFRPEDELAELYTALEAARFTVEAQKLRAAGDSTAMPLSIDVAALKHVQDYTEQADLGYLLYHISGERSFVLFVHKSRFELVPLNVSPESLAREIRALLQPLHNVEPGRLSEVIFRADLAHALYSKLLAPVASLGLPENLLVVPDFSLMRLPFEMLLTAPTHQRRYTPLDAPDYKDSFFGAAHAIAYSAGVFLDAMPGRTPWDANVLAFSNGASSGQGLITSKDALRFDVSWRFDALEYAKSEVSAIQAVHSNTKVMDRELATKGNLKLHGPDGEVLHFATHAFSDSMFADFAGLVLAASEDSTDDGILMGYEVQDFKINCELVTLSACETGRGQVQIGEGLLGLPRQFLAAGAKSVLMSLWKVDDRFASQMMPIFYRNYLAEGNSKTRALWLTRKEISSQAAPENGYHYQHPFYWAAFTLYGDPGVGRSSIFVPMLAVFAACVLLFSLIFLRRRMVDSHSV